MAADTFDRDHLALYNEAHRQLDRANQILDESFARLSALVEKLKSTPWNDLDKDQQRLLLAQLNHEAKQK